MTFYWTQEGGNECIWRRTCTQMVQLHAMTLDNGKKTCIEFTNDCHNLALVSRWWLGEILLTEHSFTKTLYMFCSWNFPRMGMKGCLFFPLENREIEGQKVTYRTWNCLFWKRQLKIVFLGGRCWCFLFIVFLFLNAFHYYVLHFPVSYYFSIIYPKIWIFPVQTT